VLVFRPMGCMVRLAPALLAYLLLGCGAGPAPPPTRPIGLASGPEALPKEQAHAIEPRRHFLRTAPISTDARVAITILDRKEFIVGWDANVNAPRWVAWSVTKADLGSAKRKNAFREDKDLPPGLLRVGPEDYARSGYDRGHFCPSGDRTASQERNHVTFLMTNMHAQRHALNGGPWEKLEEATRDGIRRPEDVAYVLAGALYTESPTRIGRGVAVPSHSWKTVAWTRLQAPVETAAVIMPNETAREDEPWQTYKVSEAEVATRSQLRFEGSQAER
jgi:endonuclease G, mitochondrial